MLVSLPSLSNIAGNNMARQIRKKSGTGIYHVMLRGINRQDIFEDDEDYLQMTSILRAHTPTISIRNTSVTGIFFKTDSEVNL